MYGNNLRPAEGTYNYVFFGVRVRNKATEFRVLVLELA